MMVTFVSQCQKKALARTRRVLDAFANRIGDNTWQTVITEEGLIAVKTLLRKTATKNTAVACHWIRSRSRSELVWIVGNRNQFNHSGIVPVNTTSKELIMDIATEKPQANVLYANTHLQPLAEHLFAVGYLAMRIHQTFFPENPSHSHAVFIAGCLHDLGKIDPQFQSWVRDPKRKDYIPEDGQHIDAAKFSFDKHPRHNEISVLLYELLDDTSIKLFGDREIKDVIRHAIYWHHAKPFRKDKDKGFSTYWDIYSKFIGNNPSLDFAQIITRALDTLSRVLKLEEQAAFDNKTSFSDSYQKTVDEDKVHNLKNGTPLPVFKRYENKTKLSEYQENISFNALNNIFRACVITADRLISRLPAKELIEDYIKKQSFDFLIDQCLLPDSNLISHIEQCLKHPSFSGERSAKQSEIAQQLTECRDIAVLAGPAGCGKTKIALEWAKLKNAQQIIWVCPRVQICQGLFDELILEHYLPNANIEIFTGEYKYTKEWGKQTSDDAYFRGDIVITTMDQVLNNIITHTKADSLISFLDAHVVFDEYHEYINMPAFNLFFAELVHGKRLKASHANTLLVSATPHYCFIDNLFGDGFDSRFDVVEMQSFNPSQYQIEFFPYDEDKIDDNNPFFAPRSGNTFVISNTALKAQQGFIVNQHRENAVLYHSKFIKSDKQKWFEAVYDSFKKDGTKTYDVLRSGPIVQASLNITCNEMISDICTAEDCLQRLGRLDRFGENASINRYLIAIPNSFKGTNGVGKFLSSMNSFASTRAWRDFLEAKLKHEKPLRLPQIYAFYREFHNNEAAKKEIENDLLKAMQKSVGLIDDKVTDPIRLFHNKKEAANKRGKISKNSLRGDNRFVQLAVCTVSGLDQYQFENRYAYQIPISENEPIDNITEKKAIIERDGKGQESLLVHMAKKHHQIMGGKAPYKNYMLINEARDPENPIYLSYTTEDLDKAGREAGRHPWAIYYAECDKQPIGAISIKELTSTED
ncbi:CRISPR-associated endonuclease Cas3'' [Methylomonas koyamae]|uniref:DEAD/DEAH box helicase n=1 Tax=Methylomonas koyamae TaxID=702114 RepID=A0AA91D8T8_9GAMM|nr:CRISPR-associated endonuclease Cas3'' [Methylomonas koyamae]OAI21878.1 DEAD/DEAH box helicase [Methylomonas koyamae]